MKDLFANKEQIVNDVLELLPLALSGDPANRTFFIAEDGSVDYLYYQGQINLGDRCFYTVKDYETPDPEDFGYDRIVNMDFDDCGYREQIENALEDHIAMLEL